MITEIIDTANAGQLLSKYYENIWLYTIYSHHFKTFPSPQSLVQIVIPRREATWESVDCFKKQIATLRSR